MRRALASTLIAAWLCASAGAAEDSALCRRWAAPEAIGQLDTRMLPEASGIGLASNSDLLYHNNDGEEPNFLVTGRNGGNARRITVEGFDAVDVEDLAVGPCGEDTCVFLADVGDNGERRPAVQIAIIDEQPGFAASVKPRRVVTALYPDGPHNSEAVAVHPSGDLFLVTKAGSGIGRTGPAKVYRLTAAQLAADGPQTFELLGQIPVPSLAERGLPARQVVTAMDIAPGGKRFMLLTYDYLIEIAADLTEPFPEQSAWRAGNIHRVSSTSRLIQSEAVAYDRDGRSVLYTSESLLGSRAPVMQQRCEE